MLGRIGSLEDELAAADGELGQTGSLLATITAALTAQQSDLSTNELAASNLSSLIEKDESDARETQKQRDKVEGQLTRAKVAAGKYEQQLETVSYTHLTLPTIYSV